MNALKVSAELAAIVQRKLQERPWLAAEARAYEQGRTKGKSRRRRPSKRTRAALQNNKNRSAR